MAPDNLRFHAGQRPRGRQRLPARSCPRFLRGHARRRTGTSPCSSVARPGPAASAMGPPSGPPTSSPPSRRSGARSRAGLNMAHQRHPLVDARHRRLPRWRPVGRRVPRTPRPLVPVRRVLAHLSDARAPAAGGRRLRGRPERGLVVRRRGVRIIRPYLGLRERLRPYVMSLMRMAHEDGIPPMRPLFLEFPDDAPLSGRGPYLFGPVLLVAPILDAGARSRPVYLPAGRGGPTRGPARRTKAARPSRSWPRWSGSRCSCAMVRVSRSPVSRRDRPTRADDDALISPSGAPGSPPTGRSHPRDHRAGGGTVV